MEWTVSLLEDEQIVVFTTQGVADQESSLEMARSISKTMAEHKVTRCLIDHSAISSVSGASVEIYYRPQKLEKIGIPSDVRIAQVVLPEHRDHFAFLKSVCLQFGFSFQIFNEQEPAIQWLREE
jgi:hypothetical protein